RMTVDVALAALCCAFALNPRSRLVLALAALTRETGLLLAAASAAASLAQRRFRDAAVAVSTTLPALAWYAFVAARTSDYQAGWLSAPFAGLLSRLRHPSPYPLDPWLETAVQAFDLLAIAGILAAIWLALRLALARRTEPLPLALGLYALVAIFLGRDDAWRDVYAFGRTLTPLLLLLPLASPSRYSVIPWLAVAPRILLQFVSQASRVFLP
ncbi:MAG: hypothetical protein ACRD96_14580, partial [Bryobacteraceae bacterium]